MVLKARADAAGKLVAMRDGTNDTYLDTDAEIALNSLHLPAGVDVTVTGGPDASPVNAIDRTDYYRAVTPPGEDYAEGTKGGKGPAPQIAQ